MKFMKACLHSSEEIQILLQFDEYFVRKISKVTKDEKVRESKAVQMFLQFDDFLKPRILIFDFCHF